MFKVGSLLFNTHFPNEIYFINEKDALFYSLSLPNCVMRFEKEIVESHCSLLSEILADNQDS